MFARKLSKSYTIEDYLHLENRSKIRHEFHDGELYAMAGGSAKYSRIAANLIVELGVFLRGQQCRLYTSDMKIYIPPVLNKKQTTHFLYPDASISCSEKDHQSSDRLLAPKIVFEVLSKSTEMYDRTTKFEYYKSLTSLEEYVLISQKEPKFEIFHRVQEYPDTWLITTFKTGIIQLTSIGFEAPLENFYADIDLIQ